MLSLTLCITRQFWSAIQTTQFRIKFKQPQLPGTAQYFPHCHFIDVKNISDVISQCTTKFCESPIIQGWKLTWYTVEKAALHDILFDYSITTGVAGVPKLRNVFIRMFSM